MICVIITLLVLLCAGIWIAYRMGVARGGRPLEIGKPIDVRVVPWKSPPFPSYDTRIIEYRCGHKRTINYIPDDHCNPPPVRDQSGALIYHSPLLCSECAPSMDVADMIMARHDAGRRTDDTAE